MNREKAEAGAARKTALPQESFGPAPRIILSGRSHVLLEGIRGLEEYAPEMIAASVAGGLVIIRGDSLQMEAMGGRELSVSGHIRGVEFV